MFHYVTGDATSPIIPDGIRLIVHVCNNCGAWGKGFVLSLSSKWPTTRSSYMEWYSTGHSGGFSLGAVQFVDVGHDIIVANMIAQMGIRPDKNGVPPIRYGPLEDCLMSVRAKAFSLTSLHRPTIHMPRIGCGLSGGDWSRVCPIIERTLSGHFEVYVYDLPTQKGLE